MQVNAVLEAARAAIAANTWCFAITLAADGTPHARLIQPKVCKSLNAVPMS